MKKLIFGFVFLFAICTGVFAQETVKVVPQEQTDIKYWYYPSLNVYYNSTSGEYWYYDEPTTHWMTVKTLPTTYTIADNTQHYDVFYNGADVWKENKAHKMKYKENKDGKAKTKNRR